MFYQINYVRALLVVCLFHKLAQSQLYNTRATEFDGCENMTLFLDRITTASPIDAFKLITSPLLCKGCSTKLHKIRNKLVSLVSSNILNIDAILKDLRKIRNVNRYDLLITTLMAINEFTTIDKTIKVEISNTIFYLLKKRYLRLDNFETATNGLCSFGYYVTLPHQTKIGHIKRPSVHLKLRPSIPKSLYRPSRLLTSNLGISPSPYSLHTPPPAYFPTPNVAPYPQPNVPYPNENCGCQRQMIELLLDRLIALENHRRVSSTCATGLNLNNKQPTVGFGIQYRPGLKPNARRRPYNAGLQPFAGTEAHNPRVHPFGGIGPYNPGLNPLKGTGPYILGLQQFKGTEPYKPWLQPFKGARPYNPSLQPFKGTRPYKPGLQQFKGSGSNKPWLQPFKGARPYNPHQKPFKGTGVYKPWLQPFKGARPYNPSLKLWLQPFKGAKPSNPTLKPFKGTGAHKPGLKLFEGTGLNKPELQSSAVLQPFKGTEGFKPGLQPVKGSKSYKLHGTPKYLKPALPTEQQPELGYGQNTKQPHLLKKTELPKEQVHVEKQSKKSQNIVPVQDLMKLIPVPKYPKEQEMYQKFKKMLESPQVQQVVQNLNLTGYPQVTDLLDVIIMTILKTVSIEEIREVFTYYSSYKEAVKSHFNYASLIDALPQPRNSKEQGYYNLTKQFLTSKNIYDLHKRSEFNNASTLADKLIVLFHQILTSNTVSSDLIEAIRYYLPIVSGKLKNIYFDRLVPLLPAPTNEIALRNFNILKNVLESNDLYGITQNASLANLTDSQRLNLILQQLITTSTNENLSLAATYYRNEIAIQKCGFNYHDLLPEIIPFTEQNLPYLQVLQDYLYSVEFDAILSQLNLGIDLSDIDKLSMILDAIHTTSHNARIKEAASYLLQEVQLKIFYKNMEKVIGLIPLPKTPDEHTKHGTIKSFLMTKKAYDLLNHIDLSVFPDDKLLLEFILKAVVESDVEANIRNAFEYYIDLTEKLAAIEFITKKEIKKNFKLTEIFTDTLELKSLTLSQKDAFKKFFKYISEIKPNAMEKFDSWDQAKTRGQFMKLLFKYLLEQPETLPDIKASINVLDSLVKMDGKGALPP